jgi:hypothetical protein
MRYTYSDAILRLRPEAIFTIKDDEYDTLQWYDQVQTAPTEQEIQEKLDEIYAEEPYRLLRIERDLLFKECDWVTLRAYRTGQPVPPEWAAYMQALADLPTNNTPTLTEFHALDRSSVDWPVKPE